MHTHNSVITEVFHNNIIKVQTQNFFKHGTTTTTNFWHNIDLNHIMGI